MSDAPAPARPSGEPPRAEAAPIPRRPFVERVGMAAIAAFLAGLVGGIAAASLASGEPFLAGMAAIGTLMTAWVGRLTLVRG